MWRNCAIKSTKCRYNFAKNRRESRTWHFRCAERLRTIPQESVIVRFLAVIFFSALPRMLSNTSASALPFGSSIFPSPAALMIWKPKCPTLPPKTSSSRSIPAIRCTVSIFITKFGYVTAIFCILRSRCNGFCCVGWIYNFC